MEFKTTQNGFMAAYWLLMAAPWPRYVTQPDTQGNFAAAADLGAIFDALGTIPRHGR